MATARRKLPIPLRPLLTRIAASRGLSLQPFLPDGFDRATLTGLANIPAAPVIVDVGANVGATSLRLAQSFPEASIVAFEPAKATYDQLVAATRDNPAIRCFNLGVSDTSQTLFLTKPEDSQLARIAGPEDAEVEEIRTIVLDCFLQEQGIAAPTILKTDTEGHDMAVLGGARPLLEGAVRVVICEVGMRADDTTHTPFEQVYDYLRPFGFRLRSVHEVTYNHARTLEFCNAVFVREG